MTRWEISVGW